MENEKYFSRSWAMLTRDKGWIKPILVMAVAQLVPIAGYIGAKGYMLEWARLTAWGVDAAPKQKNVEIGKCMSSGGRGFVVELGWGVLLGIATGIIQMIFAMFPGTFGQILSGLVSFALTFITAVLGIAIVVAQVRAAIYEKIEAGFRVDRISELVKRDVNGYMRIFAIEFVGMLIMGVIVAMIVIACTFMLVPMFIGIGQGHYASEREVLNLIIPMIVPLLLVGVIFGFLLTVAYIIILMVVYNAVGLWLRQFNVSQWGRSEDPLPETNPYQGTSVSPAGQMPVQQAPTPQPQPQQAPAPQPAPQPQPQPAPQPQPEPAPVPQPAPQPEPAPQPQPAPAPEPEPEPGQVVETVTPPTIPLKRENRQDVVAEETKVAEPEPSPVAPELVQTPLEETAPTAVIDKTDDVENIYSQALDSIKNNDFVKEDDDEQY